MFRQRREDSGRTGEGPNSHSGTDESVQAHLCPTKGTRKRHSHRLGRCPEIVLCFRVGAHGLKPTLIGNNRPSLRRNRSRPQHAACDHGAWPNEPTCRGRPMVRIPFPTEAAQSHFLRPSATTESIELLCPAFAFRFSFALSSAFFLFSFLALSFLPLSPISFSLVSNPLAGVISARSATVCGGTDG